MLNAPYTGNTELDAFLNEITYEVNEGATSSGIGDPVTGIISGPDGTVIGYLYRYISVKYADDNIGTGLTNVPTGKLYYGVHNSDSSTESTNPADYTWYLVTGTFGTTKQLYYKVLGGRIIRFDANTAPVDYKWLLDPGTAIDLENIVPTRTISTNEVIDAAITTLQLAAGAVTAAKTNVAAISNTTGNLVDNSVGPTTIQDDAVTTQKITANAVTAGKIAANAITAVAIDAGAITAGKIAADAVTAANIVAGAVTAVKINVANLQAVSATLGSVNINTTGQLNSGTKTYGAAEAGFFLGYDAGAYKFDIGNLGNFLRWNGSSLSVTGNISGASNLNITGTAVFNGISGGSFNASMIVNVGRGAAMGVDAYGNTGPGGRFESNSGVGVDAISFNNSNYALRATSSGSTTGPAALISTESNTQPALILQTGTSTSAQSLSATGKASFTAITGSNTSVEVTGAPIRINNTGFFSSPIIVTGAASLCPGLNAQYHDGLSANQVATRNTGTTVEFNAVSTGAAPTVTFNPANKPGSSSGNNSWLAVTVAGTLYWIPVWVN